MPCSLFCPADYFLITLPDGCISKSDEAEYQAAVREFVIMQTESSIAHLTETVDKVVVDLGQTKTLVTPVSFQED